MARTRRTNFTVTEVESALRASGGVRASAARMLAETFGSCSRRTVDAAIARSPRLQDALDEIRETNLDLCDRQLLRLIEEGNLGAIIWYQKTFGRSRGYAQITPPDGDQGRGPEILRDILLDAIRTTTEIFPDDGDRVPTTIEAWAVPETGDPPAAG